MADDADINKQIEGVVVSIAVFIGAKILIAYSLRTLAKKFSETNS